MGVQLEENLRYLKEDNIDLFLLNRPILKKRKIPRVCEYIDIGGNHQNYYDKKDI